MEIAKVRRLCRIVFFLGAMVMFFGLGIYVMGYTVAGVVTMIVGLVVAMLCFSVTRFFTTYDMMHLIDHRRLVQENTVEASENDKNPNKD